MANEQQPHNKFYRAIARRNDVCEQLVEIASAIKGVELAIRPPAPEKEEDQYAALYATGIEPGGKAADTAIGRWLAAAGYPSLHEVVKRPRAQPAEEACETFVMKMKEAAANCADIPVDIGEDHLRRFYRSAGGIVRRLLK
ncbi:MAG: hypothetical protein QOJ27_320 [Sphingomonadales bacterium]|nr:hypothetical protein [Sphingomonadales bacterium]